MLASSTLIEPRDGFRAAAAGVSERGGCVRILADTWMRLRFGTVGIWPLPFEISKNDSKS